MKKLVSAFPGCGKSFIYNNPEKFNLARMKLDGELLTSSDSGRWLFESATPVFDSDSSHFDKSQFPRNYIDHIQSILTGVYGSNHLIFVSSHEDVREMMHENGIEFMLVYPDRSLKDEYISKYLERGSSQGFIELISKNWDDWIDSCENDQRCTNKMVLQTGQNLSDVLFNS